MGVNIICKNKKAHFDYFLHEKFEAGIVLLGTEIKSLRAGKASITEAFVTIDKKNEVWLINMNIPHYEFGNINNHQEMRKRKLLLNEKEIKDILHSMKTNDNNLIPVSLYFKESLVKIEIALAKGKKNFDKRETVAKRDIERKIRKGNYE